MDSPGAVLELSAEFPARSSAATPFGFATNQHAARSGSAVNAPELSDLRALAATRTLQALLDGDVINYVPVGGTVCHGRSRPRSYDRIVAQCSSVDEIWRLRWLAPDKPVTGSRFDEARAGARAEPAATGDFRTCPQSRHLLPACGCQLLTQNRHRARVHAPPIAKYVHGAAAAWTLRNAHALRTGRRNRCKSCFRASQDDFDGGRHFIPP